MKNSKSFFFLCSAVVFCLIFTLSSCGSKEIQLGEKLSDSEMEELMDNLNEQCPITYDIGSATNFKCAEKKIVISYINDEDAISFINMDKKDIYDVWRLLYLESCSDKDKLFIKSIILSGYSVKCVFTGSKSKKKVTLDISNEQLKNNKPLTQEEDIKTNVAITKSLLPQPLDEVTNMVDISIDKDNLYYIYDIDETNFDMSKLNESSFKDNITFGITQQFINNSSAGDFFKKVCLSGRGICYRYVGNKTGKTIDVQYSNLEFRMLANEGGLN